jgi:hypothetical protein
LCGCQRHAHAAMGGECIAGKMTCKGCKIYRPELGLGDEDDTPIIDDGLHARAKQIDWRHLERYTPNVVQCRSSHREFRSLAKYDTISSRIISKEPCPVCGSHEMRRSSIIDATTVVAGEIVTVDPRPREVVTITAGEAADLATVLDLDLGDEPTKP